MQNHADPCLKLFSKQVLNIRLNEQCQARLVPGWGGGGGGGATQQSFIRGGSALRSKPLPFYIPFLREKLPLLFTFRRKFYPFHIPTERVLLNFSFEKALKRLFEIF